MNRKPPNKEMAIVDRAVTLFGHLDAGIGNAATPWEVARGLRRILRDTTAYDSKTRKHAQRFMSRNKLNRQVL